MKVKNKKSIVFILLTVVLFIGGTIAFLLTTDTFDNLFLAGTYRVVTTEVFESPDNWKPGEETAKTVTMKNEGTIPVRIRISYDEEWKSFNLDNLPLDQDGEVAAIINFDNEDDWIYEDGYYYYYKELEPGEETSSFIKSVTFNPNIENSIVCSPKPDGTGNVCESTGDGYDEGKYTLTFNIEGAQENRYVSIWNLDHPIKRNYLYDVLQDEAETGGLARKYTGEHHDSFTEEPSKDIYHWYAKNDTEGTQVLDKNNVIFAGHCWQMIRTTDTGGVKMIYNGEADDGKCLNTRGTHVGYSSRIRQTLASNYWYGTDYTYDPINKVFSISGITEKTWWKSTTVSELIGKYTCKSSVSVDATCSAIYLIDSYYNSSSAYVLSINPNSNYSQYGILSFNANHYSVSYAGYMYNTVYPSNTKVMTSSEYMISSSSLGLDYWYADSVTWGSPTANKYNLDNPEQITSTADYPSLVGKYTFRNSTQTYSNTSVYYIAAVNGSTMYYIQLTNSANHTLSDFNHTYTYGDTYTDNGNGTYTINNPTTINRSDWYTSYSNVGAGKYVCKNAVNDTCSELWYTTATTNTSMTYISSSNNYKYSKGFSWDGSKYVLDNDTSISFWDITDSSNKTTINNAHYTCWNDTGECTTVSYIHYIDGISPIYINITNGKSVEDSIDEMLHNNNVNTINSTIKSGVDAWYKHFLLEYYDDYIEDTIFCNDRSVMSLGGWNPDGGIASGVISNTYLRFKEYNVTTDLSCTNATDQFSVSNNNAKLTYKVGLVSSPEMNLLNYRKIRNTGKYYWLASPHSFTTIACERRVGDDGFISGSVDVEDTSGVRPSISLRPGIKYTDGDGSMADPYIIKTE